MAKVEVSQISLRESDMIPKEARAKAKGLLKFQPLLFLVDVRFATREKPPPALVKAATREAEKIFRNGQGTIAGEVEDLAREIGKLQKLAEAGDDKATAKALALVKKSIERLDGDLLDDLRILLRKRLGKWLETEAKGLGFVAKSLETVGSSGFRNAKRGITLLPDAFPDAEQADSAFGKGAKSLLEEGDQLIKDVKVIEKLAQGTVNDSARYLAAVESYSSKQAESRKSMVVSQGKAKGEASFAAELHAAERASALGMERSVELIADGAQSLSKNIGAFWKEHAGLEKLVKNTRKPLPEDARKKSHQLIAAIDKALRHLEKEMNRLHEGVDALSSLTGADGAARAIASPRDWKAANGILAKATLEKPAKSLVADAKALQKIIDAAS